jgi:hypothetical protein
MRALTEIDVLELWERGRNRNQAERALLSLEVTMPALDPERCVDIGVGQRDIAVMDLQRATFGSSLDGIVTCPGCGEQLEFTIDTDAIRSATPSPSRQEFIAGNGLRFRLPSSHDLTAVQDAPDIDTAAWRLLRRCCLDGIDDAALSESLFSEVDAGLSALDAFAQFEIGFSCAACGNAWSDWFDICDWLWQEVESRARQLLDDIHFLAVAYGWSEEQILKLNPVRRAAYLERCAT